MKKFLFTLAALLMAGSMWAEEYCYLEPADLSGELGQEIEVPLLAHFDYAVSAFQCDFIFPEGLTLIDIEQGADINFQYKNNAGRTKTTNALFIADLEHMNFLTAHAEYGYWQVDGEWVPYGVNKWLPGDYEEMAILIIEVAEDFAGGEISVETQPNCGDVDARPDVVGCEPGQHNVHTAQFDGAGTPEIPTPAPEIIVTRGDDAYIFEAVGEGTITLYLDGNEVENPYTVVRTDEDQIVKFTAVAHVDGQIDGTVTGEYLVPALEPVVIPDLGGEIVIGDPDENGVVTIEYTGDEDVTITVTVNGEEVELGEDGTITVGEGESVIVVVVTAEGYNDLTGEKTVEYTAPEPPTPVTPTPEITYEVTEDAVIITATGEGEVLLYVDGVLVENPCTIERGATDVVVVVTATAQGEDMEISETATMEITIPAIGTEPEDPYAVGAWVVFFDKDGNEVYYQLVQGDDPDGVQTNVALTWSVYGRPGTTNPEEWHYIPFYFIVDGVTYGPEVDGTVPEFGNANLNPLYENENYWEIQAGFKYVVGIVTDIETGNKYVQISKGTFVGVDELNADKTISNVRYFNMAGQEMQEVNGMTIVVTTYTDGTTSAAKVMK